MLFFWCFRVFLLMSFYTRNALRARLVIRAMRFSSFDEYGVHCHFEVSPPHTSKVHGIMDVCGGESGGDGGGDRSGVGGGGGKSNQTCFVSTQGLPSKSVLTIAHKVAHATKRTSHIITTDTSTNSIHVASVMIISATISTLPTRAVTSVVMVIVRRTTKEAIAVTQSVTLAPKVVRSVLEAIRSALADTNSRSSLSTRDAGVVNIQLAQWCFALPKER